MRERLINYVNIQSSLNFHLERSTFVRDFKNSTVAAEVDFIQHLHDIAVEVIDYVQNNIFNAS